MDSQYNKPTNIFLMIYEYIFPDYKLYKNYRILEQTARNGSVEYLIEKRKTLMLWKLDIWSAKPSLEDARKVIDVSILTERKAYECEIVKRKK